MVEEKLTKAQFAKILCSFHPSTRIEVLNAVLDGRLLPPTGWTRNEFAEEFGVMSVAEVLKICPRPSKTEEMLSPKDWREIHGLEDKIALDTYKTEFYKLSARKQKLVADAAEKKYFG